MALIPTASLQSLIANARTNPPEPLIDGLLRAGSVLLLHGVEESFKSVFMTQLGEALATGTPFLGQWPAPVARRVGLVATELDPIAFGERLSLMFPVAPPPDTFVVFNALKLFRAYATTASRTRFIGEWALEQALDVLLIDVANDLVRGKAGNPNDEVQVAEMFEQLRSLELPLIGLVRHDRKQNPQGLILHSNEQIRGSGEWKEDPEVILALSRPDKRTHEVTLSVGKMRYGTKPDNLALWFDAGTCRLTARPPILAVLEAGPLSRSDLLTQCHQRFSLGQRRADELIKGLLPALIVTQSGHQKQYALRAP